MRKSLFKLLCVYFFLVFQLNGIGQVRDTLFRGGVIYNSEVIEMLKNVDHLPVSPINEKIQLPQRVDNSEQPFFRSVFSQAHNSCVHAAEIAYLLTYEVNRNRNVAFDPNDSTTFFPTHFTYNFVNAGQDNGSWPLSGFKTAKKIGCMTAKDWGGMAGSYKRWATGYEKYRNAAHNRISDYFQIYIGQPDGLEVLKHWLAHHNEGSESGGVATIVTSMNNFALCNQLPPQSDDAGAWVLTDMEVLPSGISSHEMAVVGYNDAIKYDFNGDGLFTNDRDINNDDVVDMKDWEVGALIVANSMGADWMNDGFIYWPYSLIGGGSSEGNPIDLQAAYCVNLPKRYEPSLFFDVKLRFSDRRKVEWHLGRSIAGSETIGMPQYYTTIGFLDSGSLPMNGVSDEPIEMSFELFEARENTFARNLVIAVTSRANTVGSGEFISYRIYDNDIGEAIADEQVNLPVGDNINYSFFNSRYHYISPVISEELSLWRSVIINKPVTVQGGARLEIYTDTLAFENQGKIIVEDSGTILFNRASDIRSSESGLGILLDGRMIISENLVYNFPPGLVIEGGASGGVVDVFGALLPASQQVQNIEIKVHSSGKFVVKDAVEFGHNSKLTVEGLVHVRHGGYLSLVGNSQLCGDSIEGSILVDGTLLLTDTQLKRLNIEVSGTGKVFVAGNAVFNKSTQLHLRSNSIVQGANNNARVVFRGKVQIEPNTQFIDLTHNNGGGVEFRTDEVVNLDQIQFQNSNVYVAVDYVEFLCVNCTFYGSSMSVFDRSNANHSMCRIENCRFSHVEEEEVLRIENFNFFSISKNRFNDNKGSAITLYYAGGNTINNREVFENEIRNNSNRDCAAGILLYHSNANIYNNNIINNDYGVALFNYSRPYIFSDTSVLKNKRYQQISYNRSSQVFLGKGSFPRYFRFNRVYGYYGSTSPRFVCTEKPIEIYDLRLNDWGDNFNLLTDLLPSGSYNVKPMWPDGDGDITIPDDNVLQKTSGSFNQCSFLMERLINQIEQQSSIEEVEQTLEGVLALITSGHSNIAEFIALLDTAHHSNDNWQRLKHYYLAEAHLQQHDVQSAMKMIEQEAFNAKTYEEETYSLIDAGRIFHQKEHVDASLKGQFPMLKEIPNNWLAYAQKRAQWLSEILKSLSVNDAGLVTNVQISPLPKVGFQIYPNPAANQVVVHFYGTLGVTGQLYIYAQTGLLVKKYDISNSEMVTVELSDLKSGLYFLKVRNENGDVGVQQLSILR